VCVLCHKKRTWERKESKEKKEPDYLLPISVKRNIIIVKTAKAKPCANCNKIYPHYQMEFDHIENKSFNISHITRCGCKEELLRNEINKCQILCSLCHRRKTYKTWKFYKD
ncbi:hypothetical protein LRR18_16690, partial [Mangrovimonas sp. AS39]|uniref:hypothetical protein n=1 Tax=Mangrovimonas futianensis TaxID=2895523 RepID=UPI001E5FE8FE